MALKEVNIKYFAALKEQAGKAEESIQTDLESAREVYEFLQEKYGFTLQSKMVRIALNDEYKELDATLSSGDSLVFIPPVAGG